MYGIAANVIRESARKRRVARDATRRLGLRLASDPSPTAADPSWSDGLESELEAALAALPASQRDAVVGRFLHDRSYEDLAATFGCSPGAMRVRVARGLDRLRRITGEATT